MCHPKETWVRVLLFFSWRESETIPKQMNLLPLWLWFLYLPKNHACKYANKAKSLILLKRAVPKSLTYKALSTWYPTMGIGPSFKGQTSIPQCKYAFHCKFKSFYISFLNSLETSEFHRRLSVSPSTSLQSACSFISSLPIICVFLTWYPPTIKKTGVTRSCHPKLKLKPQPVNTKHTALQQAHAGSTDLGLSLRLLWHCHNFFILFLVHLKGPF